ncbi:ATP-dependent 6-phosphofructokinase 4, chloroplastic isoform X4 [Capsicum annuum]|uniref:ATP-dependent 6-phosphofructokinase 4, chloroplastic isoform X4 n=1 Tax=Capsicum annuum TaxID=4072 RepID=UPI001FB0E03B|nr:ATP-dependent 6-phosphofructokinase 4, chloroplastic isoform X4 [Capsicum annuum]
MELSLSNSSSFRFRRYDFVPRLHSFSGLGSFHTFSSNKSISVRRPLIWRQPRLLRIKAQTAIDGNSSDDFIIEDVPHLTYFLPDLPSYTNPLKRSQAYAIVKKTFVNPEDMVAKEIIVQKDSPRGIHFRRAGPREKVFFTPEEVRACIVTCGGLCPGINTVIREIVCGLKNMYGVDDVLGIQGGYSGFYSKNTLNLTTKVVNDIHKRGGTFLQTSRGGHDTKKIVDNIQDRGINQVYIIGGDGTQKGAAAIYKLKNVVLKWLLLGFPRQLIMISRHYDLCDISRKQGKEQRNKSSVQLLIPYVIDKSFGFDTAVEEAQRAINAAHVEAESVENGVGIVKLMGRYSGFIAMLATLGNRDVDCCLIPESPFYLEGPGGLYEYVEQQLKENRHVLIVLAEGAGQEYVAQSMQAFQEKDASGNRLLLDVGLWLTQHIKFNMEVSMHAKETFYIVKVSSSDITLYTGPVV